MRVKIWMEADHRYTKDAIEFFIEDFPGRLQGKDLISLRDMIDEKDFNEGQLDQIYSLCFHVDFVSWEKDENGIYLSVFCIGE